MKTKLAKVLEELRYMRAVRNQTDFGEILGYNKSYISQMVNGSEPTNDKVKLKLREKFGVNIDYWNNDKAPMFTEPAPPSKIPELHEVNVPYMNKEELDRIAGMKTEYATKDEVSELRKMLIRLDERLYKLENKTK